MTLRRFLIVGGLVLSVLLERGAYYGSQTSLFPFMMSDLGMSSEDVMGLYRGIGWAVVFSPLLGGLLAVGIGPRITAVLGALVAAVGFLTLSLTDSSPPLAGMLLVAIGTGLFRPAVFVAIAQELGYAHDNARTGAFLLAYAGINVSVLIATFASGAISEELGFSVGFAISAFACLVVVALGAMVVGVHHGVGAKPVQPKLRGRAEVGAAVLLVLAIPAYIAISAASSYQFVGLAEHSQSFASLNPAVVTIVTLGLAVLFFALAWTKVRPLALHVAGGGMIVMALGLGVSAFQDPESEMGPALLIGALVTAIGESAIFAAIMSRVAAGSHARLGTLVFAVFMTGTSLSTRILDLADDPSILRLVVIGCALATLLAGAALIALAGPIERFFYAPHDPGQHGDRTAPAGQATEEGQEPLAA